MNTIKCQTSRAPTSQHQETNEQEQTTLSVKHIDSHGETSRFCTMTCPIDGGATLSCHRHTDMSTAFAASRYYAPLQPTGVTLPEGSSASPRRLSPSLDFTPKKCQLHEKKAQLHGLILSNQNDRQPLSLFLFMHKIKP